MRIAQVAPLAEAVPPPGYGGTEAVVSLLTEELVRRGHEVTLFASADSNTAANLVPGTEHGLRPSGIPLTRWAAYEIAQLMEVQQRADEFDIIHNHMSWLGLPFLKGVRPPIVSTNHNIIKDYCRQIYLNCRDMPYVAISDSYRRSNFPEMINYVATIYNGIDISKYTFNANPGKYLLFLGRICQDKGTDLAIHFARRVGVHLKIAGKVDPADADYYEAKVRPLLNEPGIEFIGEVGPVEKAELYSNALATIYPITFEEPFGLVMVESLASGTPLFALRRGSVDEILQDGSTAVVTDSLEGLVARFNDIEKLSREECRKVAEERFSHTKMVDGYLSVFEHLRYIASREEVSPGRIR